jgi:hypothetical protein
MVTGNFALLIGAVPKAVHLWYMEVYLDAYEWVTLPNTLGMSQFGDGGLVGTKPYAASGAYINRMSDYCPPCRYDPTTRTGEDACPFNALYWHFLDRNRDKLDSNPRLRNMYRTWDRFGDQTKADTLAEAERTWPGSMRGRAVTGRGRKLNEVDVRPGTNAPGWRFQLLTLGMSSEYGRRTGSCGDPAGRRARPDLQAAGRDRAIARPRHGRRARGGGAGQPRS